MIMAKNLAKLAKQHLEKCQAAAISAVESYNRPGSRFRSALYIVLIVIAWLAFFHAYFYRQNRKPWYQSRSSEHKFGVRYKKIDGEPQHWDLKMCLREYFRDLHPPERKNLEFLLGLRNKIEHRHLPQLDETVYGECQSALVNLEEHLVREFGPKFGLSDSLAVSLQFSRVRPSEQKQALASMTKDAQTVLDYIETYQAELSEEVLNDVGYAFRFYLVPKVANRQNSADAAIEFVHLDDLDATQRTALQKLKVVTKEKQVPVSNIDLRRPTDVVRIVSSSLPFKFNMHHHTRAWKHFEVRPRNGSVKPHKTNSNYCIYDKVHKDYGYTNAWIEKLIAQLSNPKNFSQITGQNAVER